MLLAGLTEVRPADRVVDLGTGCGIVPLILAYRNLGSSLTGLELQGELADLARRNVEANGFSERIEILQMDLRQVCGHLRPECFDLAVSNPPYRRRESGKINPDRQRALARHELTASAADVFSACRFLLRQGGRLAVVYPAARLGHLMVVAREHGFAPKDMTVIYSEPGGPARLVHLVCYKGAGEELRIQPAFFIHDGSGAYTEAMRAMYDR